MAEMRHTGIQETLISYSRFPAGVSHRVFDVSSRSGRRNVVRVALPENAHLIDGSVYWTSMLRPLGIPLPEVYFRGDLRRQTRRGLTNGCTGRGVDGLGNFLR